MHMLNVIFVKFDGLTKEYKYYRIIDDEKTFGRARVYAAFMAHGRELQALEALEMSP